MSAKYDRMPEPPAGYAACRVGSLRQITHLVILDSEGSNGGRPTMCRLTRFDTRDPGTGARLLLADLPGWSMGGGVEGPGVEQVKCPDCWGRAVTVTRNEGTALVHDGAQPSCTLIGARDSFTQVEVEMTCPNCLTALAAARAATRGARDPEAPLVVKIHPWFEAALKRNLKPRPRPADPEEI